MPLRTAILSCLTTLGVGGLFLTPLVAHVRYNTTPSAPIGFYWCTPLRDTTTLHRGDLVVLTPPPWVRDEVRAVAPGLDVTRPWMKAIVAMEGDTVCLEGDDVTINGVVQAHRPLLRDYALMPLEGCVPLAPETYFVLNEHPRSFDGRYVGVFPRTIIRRTCTALYTWKERR